MCSVDTKSKYKPSQVVGESGGCEWRLYNNGRRYVFFFHYGGGERLVVSFNINKYDKAIWGNIWSLCLFFSTV